MRIGDVLDVCIVLCQIVQGISPVFAFPSSLLQYLSVYMSISHVCCACRLLERTAGQRQYDYDEVRHQSQGPWRDLVGVGQVRRCLKYVYSPCLVAVIVVLLLSPDFYPGHTGEFACFPCLCDKGYLQSCGLAAKLQQQQLGHYEPDRHRHQQAFKALGCQLSQLSLANSSLFHLNSKCFKDLSCLRVLDLGRAKIRSLHEESFFGLNNLEVLSLSGNELTEITIAHLSHLPSLEQLLLGSTIDVISTNNTIAADYLDKKLIETQGGNSIKQLPPRFLQGNPHLKFLDISGNIIERLHQDTFLEATQLEFLDLGSNELYALPEGIFAGLSRLRSLTLNNNRLSALPEQIFAGLSKLQFLRLVGNRLSTLPERIFAGLSKLQELYVFGNKLSALPKCIFAGLSKLQMLSFLNNRLSALPDGVFAGLSHLNQLSLYDNRLIALPERIFAGLSKLKDLGLSQQQAQYTS